LQLLVTIDTPVQSLPPCCGKGLLQLRLRFSTSPLQVTEHSLHFVQDPHRPSTGHGFKLHFLVSMATPLQVFPLFAGKGFVQLRMRF